jgi:hypothetical protein
MGDAERTGQQQATPARMEGASRWAAQMKILVTADTHFGANPRDAYRLEFLNKRLPSMIKTYKIDEIYILGDITEVKDEHGAQLVNEIVDGLSQIHYIAPVTILMGNHDFLLEGWPFFRFLKNIPGLRFYTNPTKIKTNLFLPFTRQPHIDWKRLDFNNVKRIFTHMPFEGAVGSFGHPIKGVSLDLLPDIPIISGDVHSPQKFRNLTYVGAPYSVDFGDDYIGRVLILDDSRLSPVHVGGPQKKIVRAPDFCKCRAGDIVRVEVPIKASEYAKWQEKCYEISQWATENHVYLDSIIPLITDASEKPVDKKIVHAAKNDEQILYEYAKVKNIDEKTLHIGKGLL